MVNGMRCTAVLVCVERKGSAGGALSLGGRTQLLFHGRGVEVVGLARAVPTTAHKGGGGMVVGENHAS